VPVRRKLASIVSAVMKKWSIFGTTTSRAAPGRLLLTSSTISALSSRYMIQSYSPQTARVGT
jgi:hypothetical protein